MNKKGTPENLKPFKKGCPPGPGRPKGHTSMVETIRMVLEKSFKAKDPETQKETKLTGRELIALKLMQKAMNGDLKAISEIIDRLDGKPAQTIKSAAFNFDLDAESIKNMSDEELDAVEQKIIKSINGED